MSTSVHPSMQAINWHGSAEPDTYYGWTISFSGEYEDVHPFSTAEERDHFLTDCKAAVKSLNLTESFNIELIAAITAAGLADGSAALDDVPPEVLEAIFDVWLHHQPGGPQ